MFDLSNDLNCEFDSDPDEKEKKPINPEPPEKTKKPIKPEPLKLDPDLRDTDDFGKKSKDTTELFNNPKNDQVKTEDL